MKFPLPFRKFLSRQEDISRLEQSFVETGKIADAGERLLQYQALADESRQIFQRTNTKALVGTLPPMFGGIACVVIGGVTLNPLILGGGVAIIGGSMFVRASLGDDSFNGLRSVITKCDAAVNDMVRNASLQDVAKSQKFETVMEDYPTLRSRFLLAASREKVLQSQLATPAAEQTPEPEKPRNKGGFIM